MINFNKTKREDFTEYEVYTDEYSGGEGNEQLVGYVTKFGDKKWAFRTIGNFFCDVMPTDTFDSRKDALGEVTNTLRFVAPRVKYENEPREIDLKDLYGARRSSIGNNRKRTRGRNIQYVQRAERLPNGELKYLNSFKKIHHQRV